MEIEEGHYGQVDLAGLTILAVYNGGKWIKFFVSENATKAQTDAVVEFLPAAEGFFEAPVRDVRNLPISVKRTKDKVKITTAGTLIRGGPAGLATELKRLMARPSVAWGMASGKARLATCLVRWKR